MDTDDIEKIVQAIRGRGVPITNGWLLFNEPTYDFQAHAAALGAAEASVSKLLGGDLSRGPDVQRMVPLVSWVQAGAFAEVEDPFPPGVADEYYPYPHRGHAAIIAARVVGHSMTSQFGKSYPDGSIIFINLEMRSPNNGQRIVAKLAHVEEATFKVFVNEGGKKWLRPLNPQYPAITDPFRVVGTVVGKWEEE